MTNTESSSTIDFYTPIDSPSPALSTSTLSNTGRDYSAIMEKQEGAEEQDGGEEKERGEEHRHDMMYPPTKPQDFMVGAGYAPPADADDAFARDPVRPTPKPIHHSPSLSTPSNKVDSPQIFPNQKDARGESLPHPVPADDPTSKPRLICDSPHGGLPSPPQLKRRREGRGSDSDGGGGDSEDIYPLLRMQAGLIERLAIIYTEN